MRFDEFGISPQLLQALERMEFSEPTPVQSLAIRPMMEGADLLVQAPTGTGKTAAFAIPIIEGLDPDDDRIQVLILSPTRELAVQITDVFKDLTAYLEDVRTLAIYGGESMDRQLNGLARNPQVVVATPGRLMDHMRRRNITLDGVRIAVLDEADRMLDMGFRDDMDYILRRLPKQRQTVMFSATLTDEVMYLARRYQHDAKTLEVEQKSRAVDTVKQYYTVVEYMQKTPNLIHILRENSFALTLIFVGTKSMTERLTRHLALNGFQAGALHGDLRQSQRDKIMSQFRGGELSILVATDVAARGIDVTGIDAVINYDIPLDPDSYVHRIGRTGRAGESGVAYTLLYGSELPALEEVLRSTKTEMEPLIIWLEDDEPIVPYSGPGCSRTAGRPDRGGRGGSRSGGRSGGGRPSSGRPASSAGTSSGGSGGGAGSPTSSAKRRRRRRRPGGGSGGAGSSGGGAPSGGQE